MSTSKKKSAPTAATVQSASTIYQDHDSTTGEEVQGPTPWELELVSAFQRLSREKKEDVIQFADFLLERQYKGECTDYALEEWQKRSKLWNKTSEEEAS